MLRLQQSKITNNCQKVPLALVILLPWVYLSPLTLSLWMLHTQHNQYFQSPRVATIASDYMFYRQWKIFLKSYSET
jgi:hypothetical protein